MASANPFDLAMTQEIARLFATPKESRDDAWGKRFLAAIPRASLKASSPQVLQGPDGYPYFSLSIPEVGKPFESFSIVHVLEYCCEQGIGAVIFEDSAGQGQPGWVFSGGDLASYRLYGSLEGDPLDRREEDPNLKGLVVETVKEGRNILMAAPSESYLPKWSRRALGKFLKQVHGVEAPKAALMIDPQMKPTRNLVMSVSASELTGDEKRTNFLRSVSWFLPRGRGLMLRPDSMELGTQFVELG